ncbi:hypothetical protein DFQ27_000413 [Actinomortierella ambigua]|uniref:non-specific serine/threonine protein kinase n=1 Tax=Actinomortierella ambigua TaxID=1343610 RepID=A0A9P6QM27_9FUNG|nr:hypothetical protein DFQ27_000413 [Actinomortierella ambigua]
MGECIGAGTFGIVFQGRYNTRKAAIKKFRLYQYTTEQLQTIEQEIGLLKHLQYRHIIQFYGVHRQDKEVWLVTDFAEGGSLKQAIEDSRVDDWPVKSRIAQEIADGLAYIHHEGILHRDLKSDNVLLTRHMEVKLCDFGLAVIKTSSGGHSTQFMRGTFRWLAPELVLSERPRYTTKSDMYALGMVMWEMAAMCTVPFKAMTNNFVVAHAVHGGRREQLPGDTPADYRRWVDLCWKPDPSERPAAHEVIIVDDASPQRELVNTAGTSAYELTTLPYEQGEASVGSSSVFSATEEPRAVHPPTDFFSLSRKATLNDVDAQVSLAEMYETGGSGVPQDNEMAFVWYLRAAQQGHTGAMDRVGDMYAEGRGTEQSDDEAARWHKQATEQRRSNQDSGVYTSSQGASLSVGHDSGDMNWFRTTTQKRLADMESRLLSMMNVLENDPERVKARAEIQAAEGGDARAQFNVAKMYLNGRGVEQSVVEAVKWYTRAASQGHQMAQNNLGWMYDVGNGVEQDDTMAVEWYKKSSAQGNAFGHGNLASMYELGFGVEASDNHALDLFTRAHDKGSPNAHFHIKWLTSPDRRAPCSDSDVVEVNRIGAEKGYVAAQHNLGRLYERGRGVRMDKDEALAWYRKAAAQGHTGSPQRMVFLQ